MGRQVKRVVGGLLIGAALAAPQWAAGQIPIPVPMPMNVPGLQNLFKGSGSGAGEAAPSSSDEARDAASCETGGVLGGMLGSSMFKNNSALGGAAGAVGGCLIARGIARELTKNERVELQGKTQDMFDSPTPSVTYESEEKHKTVTITRGDSTVTPKTWQVDALANVTPPHDGFNVVGKTYYARRKVNLRAYSSTEGEIVGSFRPNEAVFVMGRTYDGAWNLIGSDDVLVGYASTSLFSSSPIPPEAAKARPPAHPVLAKGQSVADAQKTKVSVNTSTTCTQVRQQVGNATGLITGCKSPNGGWNLA
jgi:hypothetical protein